MNRLLQYLLLICFLGSLGACKSKKPSLSGDDPVEVGDFIDFFPVRKLPVTVADSSFSYKENDSLKIAYKVFTQFVPDSVLNSIFGKTNPTIYPMARAKGDEIYLFVKAITPAKKAAFVVTFDRKNNYLAAMPVLVLDANIKTHQSSTLDNKFTLTKNVTLKNTDGVVSNGSDVYALNKDAGNFMLIMTDPLDDKVTEVLNPLDTLSRKQKYASDYGSGKMTLFSFRDGRRADRLSFFIHFEKNNGECTGELKGEAVMRSATQAVYREPGDPCAIQFNFTSSAVVVKEIEGCGSRRGLRCSFDGVYPRKKESKPKATKPKTTQKKK